MTLLQGLQEQFSSTWKLLSDTTSFLSKTSILDQYENELRAMRLRLTRHGKDKDIVAEVKNEVIAIRKALRLNGYDLTLGDFNLIVDEFKNDADLGMYRRMVVLIGKDRLWVKTGEANHLTLHSYLSAERHGDILQSHFLWYRWQGKTLFLSGSDSEQRSDFEALKKWSEIPENKFLMLRCMKNIS